MNIRHILIIIFAVLHCSTANAQFNPADPAEPGNKYRLTLLCSPEEAGNIYGGGAYAKGSKVNISATPNYGYSFSCWKDGDAVVSTAPSIEYIMPNTPTTLTAYFEKDGPGSFNPTDPAEPNSPGTTDDTRHTLTVKKDPETGGRLNHESEVKLKEGETVYLYADLSRGYEIDGWYINGILQSIQANYSYTMKDKDETLTVRFKYSPIEPTDPGSSENKEFILIDTQAKIEEYANIEEFPRSVRIIGTDITSLQSLSRMKKINGDLRIENTSLTTLEGLDNLTEISGKLIVSDNRLLTTMDGIGAWGGISYVLIENNPILTDYCSMTEYALKGETAYGDIRNNAYNPTFKDISDGLCSKNEDIFRVESCKAVRHLDGLHFSIAFSNEPASYQDLKGLFEVRCEDESLSVKLFKKTGLSYDIYTSFPAKAAEYTLRVSNDFQDIYGRKLNQNGNSTEGETGDCFTKSFPFNKNELLVANQSPLEGSVGEKGYTEIAFNSTLAEPLKPGDIKIYAPSGNTVAIESVEYIDTVTPKRYRIDYAPITEDGRHTFTLSAASLKSADGKDMICDYVSYIDLVAVNLQPTKIRSAQEWISGERQTITYNVTNKGAKNAEGEVWDVIYLSNTNAWNSDAMEVHRKATSYSTAPGKEFTNTVEIEVPADIIDGRYYLILKTNVAQSIKEESYADNLLVSDPIEISVPLLTEANGRFTLDRGEKRLLKIQSDQDTNVEIIDKTGIADMFVASNSYPDITSMPKHGSATLLGAEAQNYYYLLVANNAKSAEKIQDCDLSLRKFDLEIKNVGRTEIINHGKAWIPIEVHGCATLPKVFLTDDAGNKYSCEKAIAKSEDKYYALFDVSTLPAGIYGLYVDCAGITGIKPSVINITDAQPVYSIEAKLVLPETSRIGAPITAYIDYSNTGNVDAPAPLFVLSGQPGSTYSLSEGITYEDEIHIIGLNQQGPAHILSLGESNRVSVTINLPTTQVSPYKYNLKTIALGSDGIEEPFYLEWLDIDPNETPAGITNTDWDNYCKRVRDNVGDNWGDFVQALSKAGEFAYSQLDTEAHNYDAKNLYDIIKELDLNALDASEASKSISRAKTDIPAIEPGTIYIWKGEWLPLVEAEYEKVAYDPGNSDYEVKFRNVFKNWKKTDNCSGLNTSKIYFISHGMNNWHTEQWISNMAKALAKKEPGSTIICVDWGYYATGAYKNAEGTLWSKVNPYLSSSRIDDSVTATFQALNVAFDNKVNLRKFHLIGHSHGAHLCGRLSNRFGVNANRITALDASEELSHAIHRGGSRTNTWRADYIDYYKSSVIFGTEYLVGTDNFILMMGNSQFEKDLDMGSNTAKHGYACDWFIMSILAKDCEVGFNWASHRNDNPKVINHKGWAGVINGPKNTIENYSNYKGNKQWNYTYPWYAIKKSKNKESEWDFRTALASTFDYEATGLSIYGEDDYITVGTTDFLQTEIKNHADNLSIPLDIRMDKTQKKARQVLFISRHVSDNGFSFNKDRESITSLRADADLYYLAELGTYVDPQGPDAEGLKPVLQFNISSDLWKKLGGTDEQESMDLDFWLITGVDKSSDYKSSPTKSVTFWKGELYPRNNCKKVTLKVKRSKLSCDAGADQTIVLKKGQQSAKVNVKGVAECDNSENLTFSWEKGNTVFGDSKDADISLEVGTHTLTFRVKTDAQNASHANTSEEVFDQMTVTVKPYTPGDEEDADTSTASSWDPNEKVGTAGAGSESCILPGQTMDYTVYFENDAEKATLAAQKVTVYDVLDEKFDLTTFEFTGVEVANTVIDIPAGMASYSTLTDLRPSNNLLLHTYLNLDIDSREITAEFSSIDPETGEPTQDVWAGFLPPNNDRHDGEGHFSYRVKLKEDVADGYAVKNIAEIYFDYNECIVTNETSHTLDLTAPISAVMLPCEETQSDSIEVQWHGIDKAGIKHFDIYVAQDGGQYELWQDHTTETCAYFTGTKDHSYSFYSVATDSLGHVEDIKTVPDARVRFVDPISGIDDVVYDTDTVNISVLPSSPKANENCTIKINGLSEYDISDLRIHDVKGRLHTIIKNPRSSNTYQFKESGIYIITLISAQNTNTKETLKILVR